MASERFGQLVEQLAFLRRHLLPAPFDPTGAYDDQDGVSTRALAYRVLAHAEIESFFEDRTLEAVGQARTAWDRGQVSRVAFCLVGFCGKEMSLPPETLQAPNDNKRKAWPSLIDIGERVVPVLTQFFHFVRNANHGIKEANLLAMLLPIGIDHRKIDPAFLADMDSFGALRGLAAHSSRRTAQQGVDPATEFARVESLLPGIHTLDLEVSSLVEEIQLFAPPEMPRLERIGHDSSQAKVPAT